MKQQPLTPTHAAFNQRVADAEDRTAKYVIPLYATDEDGQRYCLGSAVLLQINKTRFLLSAAHVFDENKNPNHATNIEIIGNTHLVPISGSVIKSPLPPSGKRTDDHFDIVVIPLTNDLAAELERFTFLDSTQVDPSDKPYKQSLYTFTGYPSTKQKLVKAGTLTIEAVRYTGMPLHPEQYPTGFALGPHTGIDYSKKQMIARTGKVQSPPDPHGVSGGAIFRLGTFEEIANGTSTETLVGIAIEDHKTSLIGTNITYALEMIRAHYPELEDHLPRSEYFKIDATKGEPA